MTRAAGSEVDDTAPVTAAPTSPDRRRERIRAATIASIGWMAITITMQRAAAVVRRHDLAVNWQIDTIPNLIADPFASTWYRHVQPPLYNLFVGVVLRWSPFPGIGTLWVLWLIALAGCFLLLADLLVELRVPGIAAGLISVVALSNPNLLTTMPIASYEVPVALMLLAALRIAVAQLRSPTAGKLLATAGLLTAIALTRSLFHPVWALGVLAVLIVLRPPSKRVMVAALALPVVGVGGWMLKNQILFGEATTSSWIGFNMTRGVTAAMTPDQVDRGIESGDVSTLAHQYPWGRLDQYERWTGGCEPSRRHPSLYEVHDESGWGANFNHECFLPVYGRARADAVALMRREPGRYLLTRWDPLRWSFATASLGATGAGVGFDGVPVRQPTWMDRTSDLWLVPVDIVSDQSDWNLPLLGIPELPGRVSLTLALAFVVTVGRGVPAGVRLGRVVLVRRRHGRERSETVLPAPEAGISPELASQVLEPEALDGASTSWEALWLILAATAAMVVLGGSILEFGENGRFRTVLDPLMIAVPLAAVVRAAGARAGASRSAPVEPVSDQEIR